MSSDGAGGLKMDKDWPELALQAWLPIRRKIWSANMNSLLKTGTAVLMLSVLAGCTNPYDPGQRAAGGALIGAGSGAAIGAIAGGPVGAAIGAGVGAVAGAATGYATTPPPPPSRQQPYYPPPAPSGY